MRASASYPSLAALLVKDRLCRPGLDEPHVSETVVALGCECGAAITVELPPARPRA
jgi:hypothetical protein